MAKAHPHARLGRADLLWAFATGDKLQRDEIAELLGFEKIINPVILTAHHGKFHLTGGNANLTIQEGLGHQREIQPLSQQSTSFYRVIARERIAGEKTQPESDENQALTDLFADAEPVYFSKTATTIPEIHRSPPRYQPLMPWSRLWPFLYRVLGDARSGSQPDLAKLVDKVAHGEVISRVPRRQHLVWSEFAQILIDINDDNFPYRNDFFDLCEQLKNLRGEQGLDIQYIYDEPGGAVIRYQAQLEIIEPWRTPGIETPLLILSDLGMHAKSRRVLYDWMVFGQQLNILGCRPVVLMPVTERDVDKRLLQYFACVVWDGTSRLKPLAMLHENEPPEPPHQERLEHLLACFFPAVRTDAGLVRALRQLLPANEYDVGHEAALWHHPAVNPTYDQWGWQAGSRKNYKQKFIELLQRLPAQKQHKLVELIGRYHALLPKEIYFEAMSSLMMSETQHLLPGEVQKATNKFLAELVMTYAENPGHQGLEAWVQRYLERHDDPLLREDNDFYTGFLAYERTRHIQEGEIHWPADLPLEKIRWFISRKKTQNRYLLRQQGQNLQLVAEQWAEQAKDDWGWGGVVLARLEFDDTPIIHLQALDGDQPESPSLDLIKRPNPVFRLSAGSHYQLQTGTERLTIAASENLENLPWAIAWGMSEEYGHYAETNDKQCQVFRWYWHPPEWHQQQGMFPGFWYYQALQDNLQPDWASEAGRDSYGFYAGFKINGIKQRMRWIEPGHFMMGSPEKEPERSDNELQHPVMLTQGFWLADTTVTQGLWLSVLGDNPSHFKGENRPVETVSWNDAQKFIALVNGIKPELRLCLPTEAQWEYACRAGTKTPFSFGENITPEQVNYNGDEPYANEKKGQKRGETIPVKSLPANAWGLYEMHGNVLEWCQDRYEEYAAGEQTDPTGPDTGTYRVLRGGSWIDVGGSVRSAFRVHFGTGSRNSDFGFRLARGPEHQPVRQVQPSAAAGYDSRVAEPRQSGTATGWRKWFGKGK